MSHLNILLTVDSEMLIVGRGGGWRRSRGLWWLSTGRSFAGAGIQRGLIANVVTGVYGEGCCSGDGVGWRYEWWNSVLTILSTSLTRAEGVHPNALASLNIIVMVG